MGIGIDAQRTIQPHLCTKTPQPLPPTLCRSAMAAREATMTGAAAMRSALYNTFFRRNSVYVTTCVAAAYGSTELFFAATDKVWGNINKGVRSFLAPLFVYLFLCLIPKPCRDTCAFSPRVPRC